MTAHSKFGASACDRWTVCTSSISFCKDIPDKPSSPSAIEGTDAHAKLQTILEKYFAGSPISPSDCPHVQVAVEYITSLFSICDKVVIEGQLAIRSIGDDVFGTVDFCGVKDRVLHVIDYKHGSFFGVSPENNKQLLFYALASSELFSSSLWDTVRLTIIQPRNGGIKTWDANLTTLTEFHKLLKDKYDDIVHSNLTVFKSGAHCMWCRGKSLCHHYATTVVASTTGFDPTRVKKGQKLHVNTLTKDELIGIRKNKIVIDSWLTECILELEKQEN